MKIGRSGLMDTFTLDTFFVGKSNQAAFAAGLSIGAGPSPGLNPLYIHGEHGVGKAHLMHGIGHRVLERAPASRVVYRHSGAFISECIHAYREHAMHDFAHDYRTVDLLMIAGIQFLANKALSQAQLAETIDALVKSGKQVILAGDLPPDALSNLDASIRHCLKRSAVIEIGKPEENLCVAILLAKAAARGTRLPEEAAWWMTRHVGLNPRWLEGALLAVLACADWRGEEVSVELVRTVLDRSNPLIAAMRHAHGARHLTHRTIV